MTGEGGDDSAGKRSFVATYRDALARHLQRPDRGGLRLAYTLGQVAEREGTTLLQLVEAHLTTQRALATVEVTPRQGDTDDFLYEALAAYEGAQRGDAELRESAHADRVRAAVLNDLTSAYLAVAAGTTSSERCDEAVRQIERLLGAGDARVDLGRTHDVGAEIDGEYISAPLPGGSGRLVAIAPAGRVWNDAEHAVLQQLALLIHGPIIDARLLEFSERLERVSALLGGELEPDAIIDRLLDDGLAETTAAFGAILLLDGGSLRLAGATLSGRRVIPDAVPLAQPSPYAQVARTGVPLFLPDDIAIKRYVEEHGLPCPEASTRAWAIVPLHGDGRPFGVVEMRFEEPQSFDTAQQSFLVQVGDRLATALERGGAFSAERTARQEAELATERVSGMRELATDLSRATTRRGVAGTLLRYATKATSASSGLVAVFDSRTDEVELLATVGIGGRQAPDIPGDAVGAVAQGAAYEGDIAGAGLPEPIVEQLRADQVRSVATYPLTSGSRQIGRLVLGWSGPAVPAFDRDELRAALSMTGPAVRRAGRYDIDHEIAVTLQRSQLTVPAVEIPGITWSARYRSGSPGVAGGDWYDVIALDRGRVAVVIGDIVGKGVQAAAAMGQLRSATRALANRVDDPGPLLEALDDYVRATGQGLFSSLALVVLDAGAGAARLAVAGHPPPLLCTHDKQASLIEIGRGPLLGVDAERSTATLPVGAGDLLVLYTDGLIERRDRSLSDGLKLLVATVQAGIMEPSQLCRSVMDELADETAADDIAIVAVQLARD